MSSLKFNFNFVCLWNKTNILDKKTIIIIIFFLGELNQLFAPRNGRKRNDVWMWTDDWKPSILFYAHAFYVF